jgi:hypothetical protein
MSTDPWTTDDPQPGEFDAVLAHIDRQYVERHEGDQDARVRILVSVDGDDAKRLERIAQDRGKTLTRSWPSCLATPIAQRSKPVLESRLAAAAPGSQATNELSALSRQARVKLPMLVPEAEQDCPPRSSPASASQDTLLDHA